MAKTLIIALISAIASLISVSVGEGGLRVSLGIIVFIVAMFFNEDIDPIPASIITGIAVFLARILGLAVGGDVNSSLAISYLLEVLFYIGYGFLFEILVRRDKEKYNNPLIIILMICDFGANALELFARYLILGDDLATLTLQNLFLAAFIRSALIWIVIRIIENRNTEVEI